MPFLRITKPDGTFVADSGEILQASWQEQLNDVGALSWHARYSAPGMSSLMTGGTNGGPMDEARLQVYDGSVATGPVFVWEDDQDDPSDENGPDRDLTITARGNAALFERGIVYPVANPTGNGVYAFTTSTPGMIFKTLFQECQNRGCFPELTLGFTTTADSAGNPWTFSLDISFDPGQTLLAILAQFAENVWADWRMTGTRLDMWNPGAANGLGRDMPGVVLRPRRGSQAGQNSRQRTRRELQTVVLVGGDYGTQTERKDAVAVTRYGRRESWVAQGGATEQGTLSIIGDQYLAQKSRPREGLTLTYYADPDTVIPTGTANPTPPQAPWTDYRIGDWIRVDTRIAADGINLDPLRVRATSTSIDTDGVRVYIAELNDLLLEQDLIMAARIAALTNGNGLIVATNPGTALDRLAPGAPPGVAVTSTAYQNPDGSTQAGITITWTAVTQNTDGSACDDIDHYEFAYRIGPLDWGASQTVGMDTVSAYVAGLPPGYQILARVRAADHNGNVGPWTTSAPATSAGDATAPAQPSAPILSSLIGAVRATWNGLNSSGGAMPVDFAQVEVHVSTASGFTPSSATLYDTIRTPATVPIVNLAYGTTVYVQFVATDGSKNRSTPSVQVSATPRQAQTPDYENLSITNAAVGNLSVSKLTAGSLLADLTVAARIKTADTGARAEMDGIGFHVFDASNNETFRAATSGVQLTNGIVSGGRVEAAAFYTQPYQGLAAAAFDADFTAMDQTGFYIKRRSTTNGIYNANGDPGGYVDSSFQWSVNVLNPMPIAWTWTPSGNSTTLSSSANADRIVGETGYWCPWQIQVNRGSTAGSFSNIYLSNKIGLTAGLQYTFSFIAFAGTGRAYPRIEVCWYTNAGDSTPSSYTACPYSSSSQGAVVRDKFTRYSWTFTAPAGKASAAIHVYDAGGDPATGAWYFCGCQFEQGTVATILADAASQPNSYASINVFSSFSVRDPGYDVRMGYPGLSQVNEMLRVGGLVTATAGRRLEISPDLTSNAQGLGVKFFTGVGTIPAFMGVDRSASSNVSTVAGTYTTFFVNTPPENNAGRYGRFSTSGIQTILGIQNSSGSIWNLPLMDMGVAEGANAYGGSTYFYGDAVGAEGPISGSSDRKLKRDIVPLAEKHGGGVLPKLRRIAPVAYRPRSHHHDDDRPWSSVIADEVAAEFPDLVWTHKHRARPEQGEQDMVDLTGLLAHVLQGVRELADDVDEIRARVSA